MVSVSDGGCVGGVLSEHGGIVLVGEETVAAGAGTAGVRASDHATGVVRHASAGPDLAIDCAREQGLDLPMITG